MTARTWELNLGWNRPPLTANQRQHWRATADITRQVRDMAHVRAIAAHVPELRRCLVELLYFQPDNRRRDADNLYPTLKAACDGLVDAGIVPDDTPKWMDKRTPVLMPPDGTKGRLVLVITELEGGDA